MSAAPSPPSPLPPPPLATAVLLNGHPVATEAPQLQALLLQHGYALDAAMACAVNEAFVPRSLWAQRALQEGDRIDVVAPVTGG